MPFGTWLEAYKCDARIKNNVFETEEEVALDVTIPTRYDTTLPQIADIPGHRAQSVENVTEYFDDLLHDNLRLKVINNDVGGTNGFMRFTCDFCHVSTARAMRHCNVCMLDICELCYEEKTEAIAKKNGATKWFERKDALLRCFEHDKQGKFRWNIIDVNDVRCDGCGVDSDDKPGAWHSDRVQDLDLCDACWQQDSTAEIKQKGTLWRERELSLATSTNGFGSVLDWIPVLRDTETDAGVFYNMNTDAAHYHHVALSAVDDHGREGYFIYPGTLDEVCAKLKEKTAEFDKVKAEHGTSWTTHYNCPIHVLLRDAGHPIHYG